MNNKFKGVAFAVAILITTHAEAAVSSATSTGAIDYSSCPSFFLEFGSGVSFSNKANISVDYSLWDQSPDGYNSTLGNTALYAAGIGYTVNSLINFDFNIAHRGLYNYEKFQTSTASGDVNPLGNKTRNFNLSDNAYMLNVTLDGQGVSNYLVFNTGCNSFIQPFVGGGLGVSYNTMSNFHTIIAATDTVGNTLPDHTEASLAYQLNAGLEWKYQRLSLDAGYRYFNGGNFKSGDYFTTSTNAAGVPITPTTVTPWKGNLAANEVFLTAKVAF